MFELTDQQRALQELARDFAAQEVRPLAKDLDLEPDLARRFPWDALASASRAGLRTLALPTDQGGFGPDVLTLCLVLEELAYGDLGFASALEQTWRASTLLAEDRAARARLLPAFLADERMLLALAPLDAGDAPVRAVDGRVMGQRPGIVAGSVARLLLVEAAEGEAGTSLFAVLADRPGCRVEAADTAGRRLAPAGDLVLADCAVSDADRVGEPGQGAALLGGLARRLAPLSAISAIGVARSAYDFAMDWANRRVQGGKIIAEHPSVAMKLGDMLLTLETGRTMALRAAWAVDHGADDAERLALAARILAAQTAHRVCYDAMQIWGGQGFMREGGMEKFTRDAAASYTEGRVDAYRERLGRLASGRA